MKLLQVMAPTRQTKRRTKLERFATEVIGMRVNGLDQRDIARRFKVTESAVSHFFDRHADEYLDMEAQVAKGVEDYMIAHKVNRTAVRDMLHAGLLEVRRQRSKGLTGADTGLVVREYKMLGSGENATMVEEWKIDKSLVELIDRLERSTAEELGQLPKAGINVNIDNRTQVLVREVLKDEPAQLEQPSD